MYYVDTSVLISYVFASESAHRASREVLESIAAGRHRLYASSFTLVEVCNTICRKIVREKKWRLVEPLQEYVGAYRGVEERCRFLQSLIISFLKEKLGIEFVDEEDFYRFVPTGLNELKIPRVFKNSIDLSSRLGIRIKDLLHLVYASMMSKTRNIKYFLTRDIEDFEKVRDKAKQLLQIEIVLIR